jgi:phospholipase/carboxylesterase
MNFQPLKYLYRPSGNPEAYTLLLLHGTGGNEHDLLPLAANFGDNYNILSLRGNVSENGMPRFFKRLGMGIFDEQDLHFRTEEMMAFVKELAVKEGFDASKIIALGYSNGANIAGAALVKYPDFLAGAVLYRPMQPFKQLPFDANADGVPVFFTSGKADPTVNPDDTQSYLKNLDQLGFNVEFHNLNTGHQLMREDIMYSAQWLQKYFG